MSAGRDVHRAHQEDQRSDVRPRSTTTIERGGHGHDPSSNPVRREAEASTAPMPPSGRPSSIPTGARRWALLVIIDASVVSPRKAGLGFPATSRGPSSEWLR
jgi:hypothetical protein